MDSCIVFLCCDWDEDTISNVSGVWAVWGFCCFLLFVFSLDSGKVLWVAKWRNFNLKPNCTSGDWNFLLLRTTSGPPKLHSTVVIPAALPDDAGVLLSCLSLPFQQSQAPGRCPLCLLLTWLPKASSLPSKALCFRSLTIFVVSAGSSPVLPHPSWTVGPNGGDESWRGLTSSG